MADSTYEYMINAILNYYSSGSDIWQKVNTGNASSAEIYNAFSYIPQIKIDKGIGGNTIGISYADPLSKMQVSDTVEDIIGSVNSNGIGSSYGNNGFSGNIPANFGYDSQQGQYYITNGSTSGLGTTLSTIADRASLAVTGVNIGCKLGKFIDQTLYDLAPDFWDEHLPSINPATWSSLCGQSEVGDFFLRTLLNVTDVGTTAYIDEEVLAYYYQMMRDTGVWEGADPHVTPSPTVQTTCDWTGLSKSFSVTSGPLVAVGSSSQNTFTCTTVDGGGYNFWMHRTGSTTYVMSHVSNTYGTVGFNTAFPSGGSRYYTSSTSPHTNFNTTYQIVTVGPDFNLDEIVSGPIVTVPNDPSGNPRWDVANIIYTGTISSGGVDGITDMTGAQQYPPTNITGTTTQQVLNELKQQYPDLFTGSITESTMQEDGTIDEKTYVPIPWVTDDFKSDTATTIDDATQDDYYIEPETLTKTLEDTTDPTTPDTGDGSSEIPVLPTGNASSLWAVYNPTQGELNSFGAWLWSSNFVEQIKRLFVDPMQAIIGVHKVFSPVITSGTQTIKAGYLDSGVSANVVSSQYTTIDCGTVSVNEFFGNVFDYEPFTTIHCYLPFIGVVQLSTADVMRGKVNITYGVDVITGACLAKIKITRDGNSAIIYSYGGSCAVHYPVSSGSYSGIISGLISAAVGVGTSIATGNPLAAVGGVVSGIHQAKLDVNKSGGFTGASGAVGPKIPYLIISRPQIAMARGFDVMTGYPANQLVQIKDCEGYIKCKETHIESNKATQEELNTIETMLKNGILI